MSPYPEIVAAILQEARAKGLPRISLVDVIWQYDARNKLAILPEEINDALATIDWIDLRKEGEELFLVFLEEPVGEHVCVGGDDFSWADREYRRRFSEEYRRRNAR